MLWQIWKKQVVFADAFAISVVVVVVAVVADVVVVDISLIVVVAVVVVVSWQNLQSWTNSSQIQFFGLF